MLRVAVYWRTTLTLRRFAPLSGVSKSAADRIIGHLGPSLALQPRKRFREDAALIVDGTLTTQLKSASASASTWAIGR